METYMEIYNSDKPLFSDFKKELKKGGKLSVAAASFSIYAYEALRKELNNINEFRFIYTEPTFTNLNEKKERREFYIPRLSREKSIYGTEFEMKLKNKLTQKSIARECAEWISKKASFKSNSTKYGMSNYMILENAEGTTVFQPINEFTLPGLMAEKDNRLSNFVFKIVGSETKILLDSFEEIWQDKKISENIRDEIIENIESAFKENPPELIYYFTLYNVFKDYLENLDSDYMPNELTGFKETKIWNMLYDFQKDASLAIINKLEQYNGCILADSVGLGKTFTALSVIKYYELRNKSVLVLCPKKLGDNWTTYRSNYTSNPLIDDRLRYDVFYHTDLSRERGQSNGQELEKINWSNYDLVVIDESHNFRNGGQTYLKDGIDVDNRYNTLLNKVIRPGVRTKVLMLSATPVNNKFLDLKNQIALSYEGKSELLENKLDIKKSIDQIFRNAQKEYNLWSELDKSERTSKALLDNLDLDFFEILDSVTIARSRNHIKKYYDMNAIGNFPSRLKPLSVRENLTDLKNAVNYQDIYDVLNSLNLMVYSPTAFIHPSKQMKYDIRTEKGKNLSQSGRETGIKKLMGINLLKRLESSVNSFDITLNKVKNNVANTIIEIDAYKKSKGTKKLIDVTSISEDDLDFDDLNTDLFSVGKKMKIDLEDMDVSSWKNYLIHDLEYLELLISMIKDITPKEDNKLNRLKDLIDKKIRNPINGENKKLIIFTAFADTAEYLYENLANYIKEKYDLETAMVTGTIAGRSTIKGLPADLDYVLTRFSPISKGGNLDVKPIDILIGTDCISEGQNLQDCDYLINYDIHWNPVRIIQRFGRIDRIGSKNEVIQLVNFWPDVDLDEYINLKSRVENRMTASIVTATGDDNFLDEEEKGDLEYRKSQLERLQKEVVDLEDMTDGISIIDLGLNDFRSDLLNYKTKYEDPDTIPSGIHSIVEGRNEYLRGVIFVLKNKNENLKLEEKNQIHPYYLVYISEDGEVIKNYLKAKEILDILKYLCQGVDKVQESVTKEFNKETSDGDNMVDYSMLLTESIDSIIEVKEESDIDSFISGKDVSFLGGQIEGVDDFELVTFLVVK